MGLMLKDIYKTAKHMLANAGIESSDFETNVLIEEICGISKEARIRNPELDITEKQYREFFDAVSKRAEHYPLQYIIKNWDFYGLNFKVGKGVLIPRPDTEILVEHCIEYIKSVDVVGYKSIADLCSGTGCIALALENSMRKKSKIRIYALEYEEEAYSYLISNIKRLKSRVISKQSDVISTDTVKNYSKLDLVVSNPPYLTRLDMSNRQEEVTYEPFTALYGGEDGLYYYQKIIQLWKDTLKKGGMMAFEIGRGQHRDVKKIFEKNGYSDIQFKKDYSGIIRVVSAKR